MNKPPDAQAFFGTDQVGRDTLSRVIYAARTSLSVAFGAVLLGTTLGSLWGVACGYLGGRFDLVSQRVMEILQSFPDGRETLATATSPIAQSWLIRWTSSRRRLA